MLLSRGLGADASTTVLDTSYYTGAAPGVSIPGKLPWGSIGDQYNTCLQAGGDAVSCAGAVISTNPLAGASSTGGTSTWLLPVGLAIAALVLIKMMSR